MLPWFSWRVGNPCATEFQKSICYSIHQENLKGLWYPCIKKYEPHKEKTDDEDEYNNFTVDDNEEKEYSEVLQPKKK